MTVPTRRNQVWQTDFTRLEISSGTVWWISPVTDYYAKVCLAAPVSSRIAARDAIAALDVAITTAELLLDHSLLQDCTDLATGEITPVIIVTDNGPAYKSADFARFIHTDPNSPTSAPATTRPRPTASSNASTRHSNTSISTATTWPTGRNW